jgi:hypothetical protein
MTVEDNKQQDNSAKDEAQGANKSSRGVGIVLSVIGIALIAITVDELFFHKGNTDKPLPCSDEILTSQLQEIFFQQFQNRLEESINENLKNSSGQYAEIARSSISVGVSIIQTLSYNKESNEYSCAAQLKIRATLNKPTMMSTPVAKIAVAVSWHDKCRADACFWLP